MAFRFFLTIVLFSITALGHMEMTFPPPFRSSDNPFAKAAQKIDYSMTSPLSGPAQFPCKGYLTDLTSAVGAPVVTWTQGSSVNFTLGGSAVHGGGSCQAAISNDAGKSFFVIHTYQGGCPLAPGSFQLDIPSDTPTGNVVFAWLWYNNIGNREIYMNCASVTIASGSGTAPKTAFSARPDLFVANLANGCTTVETTDVLIPNPGPDVTTGGTAKSQAASGTCSPVNGIGGRTSGSTGSTGSEASGNSSSVAPAASRSTSSVVSIQIIPTSSASPSGFITSATAVAPSSQLSSATSIAPSSQSTGSSTSGLTPTIDGQCSGSQTCAGQSIYGQCCSQWGFCGVTDAHCGTGCMAAFGVCGINGTSSTGAVRARYVRRFRN
ncbi:hypothetical protein EG329_011304 [Mollisiaceae sp. DMI_Dod_QoI]|nr:hypothetical protein EG329_011304 [Helotiales sp. DMI_Dod_QoI]